MLSTAASGGEAVAVRSIGMQCRSVVVDSMAAVRQRLGFNSALTEPPGVWWLLPSVLFACDGAPAWHSCNPSIVTLLSVFGGVQSNKIALKLLHLQVL